MKRIHATDKLHSFHVDIGPRQADHGYDTSQVHIWHSADNSFRPVSIVKQHTTSDVIWSQGLSMLLRPLAKFLHCLRRPSIAPKRIVKRLSLCEQLEARLLLSLDAVLLQDIDTHSVPMNSNASKFTEMNGMLFFEARTLTGGRELWKSDGTAAGTVQVLDIFAGSDGSYPSELINLNGVLYFSASNQVGGAELWKSNGTTIGTVQVKDIFPGATGSTPKNLTNVNDTLFFTATDHGSLPSLWKSDGTAAGTVKLKDVFGATDRAPYELTNVNGTLYFSASDQVNGIELWKSDGTSDGTIQVKDMVAGSGSSSPAGLTEVNGTLFFSAIGPGGKELYKSDGTSAGTVRVKDIISGSAGSFPQNLTNVNGTLFFSARDELGGYDLWKTDGTDSGTVPLKGIRAGSTSSSLSKLTNVNGTLYFVEGILFSSHFDLWKSDGTTAGTVLVKSFPSGPKYPILTYLTNVNGTLYFRAYETSGGDELWKSDGTPTGTVQVSDIVVGSGGSDPREFANIGGMLYFNATDATSGKELWKSDGTQAGTVEVKDINAANIGSYPQHMRDVNGALYFVTYGTPGSYDIWKTDGSMTGTVLVKNIVQNSGFSPYRTTWTPDYLTNVNGTLYFKAADAAGGVELWKSDGTTAGTFQVKDILPGVTGSYPSNLIDVNGILYFIAFAPSSSNSTASGQQLWKSDGTVAGTVVVKDFDVSKGFSGQYYLTNVNGTLYFAGSDTRRDVELWKSDGTSAGTVQIKDIYTGSRSSDPRFLTSLNGMLYFFADDAEGHKLWRSDGTDAGTVPVKLLSLDSSGHSSHSVVVIDETIYFTSLDGVSGNELWKSDGTTEGTVQVRDIFPGAGSSNPVSLTNVNGMLYFSADDGVNGAELWKSDGTAAGTVQIKDIFAGNGSSVPRGLVNWNGIVFFSANDGISGRELWKTDGTSAGTRLVADIAPNGGSIPGPLNIVNGHPLFSATSDVTGRELWTLPDEAVIPVILTNQLTISEGASLVLSSRQVNSNIPNHPMTQLTYIVSELSHGQFELVTSPGIAIAGFTQAQINAGAVRFVHDGGEAAPAYSLTLHDLSLSSELSSATITFNKVNDAPTITTNTLSVTEGGTVVLGSTQINSSDPDSIVGELIYTASGVTHGQFELLSAPGVPVNRFTNTQINTGAVQFVHDGGENAPEYSLIVSDGSRSSSLLDCRVTFSNVEDPPSIATNSLSISEEGAAVLNIGQLNSLDPDNTAAQVTYTASGVSHGQFEFVSFPGVAISIFTQMQINAGSVRFVHDGGEVAPVYSLVASDGLLTSAPSVAVVTFNQVNDAPVIVSNVLNISEGGEVVLSNNQVRCSDPDNTPLQLSYIVSRVAHGRFELVMAPGNAITVFTQAQLTAGAVRFVHDGGEIAPDYSLTVNDGLISSAVSSVVLAFGKLNDGPLITANHLTISEGGSVVLGSNQIDSADPDNTDEDLTFTVAGLSHGQFESVSVPGVAITTFTQAQIDAGAVQFVHDGGEVAPGYSLTVSDGLRTSTASASIVTFININDSPIITSNSFIISEGSSIILSDRQINAVDPDNVSEQLTYAVSGVIHGHFEFVTAQGISITSFTQAQVKSSVVRFVQDGGEAAPGYLLILNDGSISTAPSMATISFSNVNDGPTIITNQMAITEGGAVAVGSSQVNSIDPDNNPSQLIYAVSAVNHGQFESVSAPGVAITTFTQAQIEVGAVRFVHDGGQVAPGYSLTVSDGLRTSAVSTGAVTFSNVNDAPIITTNSLTISEGGSSILSDRQINAVDPDNVSEQLTYAVSGVIHGHFEFVTAQGISITSFTQAQVKSSAVRFVHDGGEAAPGYFLILNDGSISSAPSMATISFRNVNDGPTIITNQMAITEGEVVAVDSSQLNSTDPDNTPSQLTYAVSGVNHGQFELVSARGIAIHSFDQGQVNSGAVLFIHDGGEEAPSYTLSISDGTVSSAASTSTIAFYNVNDPPTNLTLSATSIAENNSPNAMVGTFAVMDPDAGETFTYSLVEGAGGEDNASFAVVGNVLKAVSKTDFEARSSYSIRIRATDHVQSIVESSFTIQVTPLNDNSPVFTSLERFEVPENRSVVEALTAIDMDLPLQVIDYSITGGKDRAGFVISTGGVLNFITAPDFENPMDDDRNNVYSLQVTADDRNGGVAVRNITVIVMPVNDNLPIVNSRSTFTVSENSVAIGTITATDADLSSQDISYALSGGPDQARILLTSGGVLYFATAPDFENPGDADGDNIYNVQVTADDGNGGQIAQNISVVVMPVNDNAPVFFSPAIFSVPEHATVVGTTLVEDIDLPSQVVQVSIVGGADRTKFSITSDGELAFIVAPDFERPSDLGGDNAYQLQVAAIDSNGITTLQNIVVMVTDVIEGPFISLSTTPIRYLLSKKPVVISIDPQGAFNAGAPSSNLTGSKMSISLSSNGDKKDVVGIHATPSAGFVVKGKSLVLPGKGGKVFGTFRLDKKTPHGMLITFGAAATSDLVQNVIRALSFSAANVGLGPRSLQIQMANVGGSASNVATRQIICE